MRPLRVSLAIAILAVTSAAPLVGQEGQRGRAFTPADWYRVTTVSSPALSPDGKQITFTVTTVNESANKRHSEIWLVGADGGEPVRLTSPGTEKIGRASCRER